MKSLKIVLAASLLCLLQGSASSAAAQPANVQRSGIVYYDANRYPNGVQNVAKQGKLQLAMDANGVMFDQDESVGTRIRLMTEIAAKKGGGFEGWGYALWAAQKGFSIKKLKNEWSEEGNPKGFCSDAIMMEIAEEENDPFLLQALRDATLQVVTPNIEVAHILKKLTDHGHHIAVLSNMGNQLLYLQEKQLGEKIDAGAFEGAQLEAAQTLHKIIGKNNPHNVVASTLTGNPHKPADEAYQTFLERNQNGQIMTVLVDDKLKNIQAAVKNGFVGILCEKEQAAEALKQALPYLLGVDIFAAQQ